MKAESRCTTRASGPSCRPHHEFQNFQAFPTGGPLGHNLGLPLPLLIDLLGRPQERAYSYVASTVQLNHERETFEQRGSAPNFQGGLLTLCTCKHQMRATQTPDQWMGVWLVGFTSRTIYDGKHWLFYLAKIASAHESHADLWAALQAGVREAKAADAHYFGDLYRPKSPPLRDDARFSPGRYVSPGRHAHRWHDDDGWHNDWHNDISYGLTEKFGRPPLLVADPQQTFIWNEPMIHFEEDHCRNFLKWSSLQELVARLRGART